MSGEIERVLGALEERGARYLVVGGVAVVLHGYLRSTGDLDLFVDLEESNVLAVVEALEALGYAPRAPVPARELADPARRRQWVEEKNLRVFTMWKPARPDLEVDLFATEPIPFAEAFTRSVRYRLAGVEVSVAGVEDLIALKLRAGRHRDLDDVEALRALLAEGRRADDGSGRVEEPVDWSYEGTERAQRIKGLALSPAERAAWLDRFTTELLALRARGRDSGRSNLDVVHEP